MLQAVDAGEAIQEILPRLRRGAASTRTVQSGFHQGRKAILRGVVGGGGGGGWCVCGVRLYQVVRIRIDQNEYNVEKIGKGGHTREKRRNWKDGKREARRVEGEREGDGEREKGRRRIAAEKKTTEQRI